MANGILQDALSGLGIDPNAGNSQLQQALAALQAVGVPTAEQLNLPELQKYVSAGVLSPQQYQAIMADPDTYSKAVQANTDNTGLDTQKEALSQLSDVVNNGGSTAINKANLQNNIDQTNQAMQAARGGIEDDAKQRGVFGGGLDFVSKLLNEQGNAETANKGAVDAAGNNAQLALNALSQKGTLGTQVQGQSDQRAQALAEAAKQIAEYNSQLQSSANQYNTQTSNDAQAANLSNAQNLNNMNTQNANMRTQYNAQIPQQVFNDQIQKAGGVASNYGQQSGLAQQQNQMYAGLVGNLIGSAGNVAGSSMAAKKPGAAPSVNQDGSYGYNPQMAHGGEVKDHCYAQGGEVHDHELCMMVGGSVPGEPNVPGDSSDNDTVHAMLSPHEIVLPNSVTQSSDPAGNAANFVANVQGGNSAPMSDDMKPSVNSFSELLQKLEENGLELRLTSKGM